MDFNFRETYQNLPDEELLHIVTNAEKYQPEAVAAARELLARRGVTEDAIIEHRTRTTAAAAQIKKISRNRWSGDNTIQSAAELLDPRLRPDEVTANIPRWVKLLLLAVLLACTWLIYSDVRSLYIYFHYAEVSEIGVEGLQYTGWTLLNSGLMLAGLYLLWKGKKWGWILLAQMLVTSVFLRLFAFIGIFFGPAPAKDTIMWFVWFLPYAVLLYGWFQERFIAIFNAGKKDKIIACVIALVLATIQTLMYASYYLRSAE